MVEYKGQEDKTEQADQSIRARDRFLKKCMDGTRKNLGTGHTITNHGHGRRRRLSSQRWSYFSEENNHGRKKKKQTSKSREREGDPGSRGTRNTKQTRLEKGLPVSNHTLRMYNKGSTRKATKEKDSSSRRERQAHQNNCWLFNQNLTCTEGSVWGISKSKRSQLPTQLTVTCRTISGNWRW